jgi:hypothetical protein
LVVVAALAVMGTELMSLQLLLLLLVLPLAL